MLHQKLSGFVKFLAGLALLLGSNLISAPQTASANAGAILQSWTLTCNSLNFVYTGVPSGQFGAIQLGSISPFAIFYDDWNNGLPGGTKTIWFTPNGQGTINGSASFPATYIGDTVHISIYITTVKTTGGQITYTAGNWTAIVPVCGKTVSGSGSSIILNFMDGRCNQEPWQAFAIYPDNKGGYYFYAIYQGVGYYAMHVTEQYLDDNPDTGVNHVIAQADGVQLWRLAGGALQATRIGLDNKLYSFNITCGMLED